MLEIFNTFCYLFFQETQENNYILKNKKKILKLTKIPYVERFVKKKNLERLLYFDCLFDGA
jgi:hypothetical protein